MSDDKKVRNLGKGKIDPNNIGIEFPFNDMDTVLILGIGKDGNLYHGHSEMSLPIMTLFHAYLQSLVTSEIFDLGNP